MCSAAELHLEGNNYFQAKNYKLAASKYIEALVLDPTNSTLYSNLSQAYLKNGIYREAELQAREAIKHDKDSLKAYYRAAKAASAVQDIDHFMEAKEYLAAGINRPKLADSTILIDFYIKLSELPPDFASKIPVESKRSKKQKKVTSDVKVEINIYFARVYQKILSQNSQYPLYAKLSVRKQEVDLTVALKQGTELLLEKNQPGNAVLKYRTALNVFSEYPLKTILPGSMVETLIKWAMCFCWYEDGDYQDIRKGHEYLCDIKDKFSIKFPIVFNTLSKYYIMLNRFDLALSVVEEGLSIITKDNTNFQQLKLPESDVPIWNLIGDSPLDSLHKIKTECKVYHKPDAICRHDRCQNLNLQIIHSRHIFFSDIDFMGFMEIQCESNCLIEYHLVCWKNIKESRMLWAEVSDKDLLGTPCPTDECYNSNGDHSVIIKITSLGANRTVKDHFERSSIPIPNPRHNKKKSEPLKPVGKEKLKPKQRIPTVKKIPLKKQKLSIEEPQISSMEKVIQEFNARRASNNNYANNECWDICKPFYGRFKLKLDKWFIHKDADVQQEFIFSFFYELLSNDGPKKLEDVIEIWEDGMENYPQFRQIAKSPGFSGIVKFISESYRFVIIGDLITLALNVHELEANALQDSEACVLYLFDHYTTTMTSQLLCNDGKPDQSFEKYSQKTNFPSKNAFTEDPKYHGDSMASGDCIRNNLAQMRDAVFKSYFQLTEPEFKPHVSQMVVNQPGQSHESTIDSTHVSRNLPMQESIFINTATVSFSPKMNGMPVISNVEQVKPVGLNKMKPSSINTAYFVPIQNATNIKNKKELNEHIMKNSSEMGKRTELLRTENKSVEELRNNYLTKQLTLINEMMSEECQTDITGNFLSIVDNKMLAISEENNLLQRRVVNADEITSVLLDNRKKSEIKLQNLLQERSQLLAEKDVLIAENNTLKSEKKREEIKGAAEYEGWLCEKRNLIEQGAAECEEWLYEKRNLIEQRDQLLREKNFLEAKNLDLQKEQNAHWSRVEDAKKIENEKLIASQSRLTDITRKFGDLKVAFIFFQKEHKNVELDTVKKKINDALVDLANPTNFNLLEDFNMERFSEIKTYLTDELKNLSKLHSIFKNSLDNADNFKDIQELSDKLKKPYLSGKLTAVFAEMEKNRRVKEMHDVGVNTEYFNENKQNGFRCGPIQMPPYHHPHHNNNNFQYPNFGPHYMPVDLNAVHPMYTQPQWRTGPLMRPHQNRYIPPLLQNGPHPHPMMRGTMNYYPNHQKPLSTKYPNIINEIFGYKAEVRNEELVKRDGTNEDGKLNEASGFQPIKPEGKPQQTMPKLQPVVTDYASAGTQEKNSLQSTRLMQKLVARFPNSSLSKLRLCVEEVRSNNDGSLQGLTPDAIMTSVQQLINKSKTQKCAWGPVPKPEPDWKGTEDHECAICIEQIYTGDRVQLSCKHIFHAQCIHQWMAIERTCPNCKCYIKLEEEYPPLK